MAGNFHPYQHYVVGIHHAGGVALLIAQGERCPRKNTRLTRIVKANVLVLEGKPPSLKS